MKKLILSLSITLCTISLFAQDRFVKFSDHPLLSPVNSAVTFNQPVTFNGNGTTINGFYLEINGEIHYSRVGSAQLMAGSNFAPIPCFYNGNSLVVNLGRSAANPAAALVMGGGILPYQVTQSDRLAIDPYPYGVGGTNYGLLVYQTNNANGLYVFLNGTWARFLTTADNALYLSTSTIAPTSSTDTGTKGEVRITGGYRYECINTNSWIRSAATTF